MAFRSFSRSFAFAAIFAGGVLTTGCSGEAASVEDDLGAADDAVTRSTAAVTLTEIDNGKSFDVTEGQSLVVKLAANATTGFQWQVATTSRTLGYPTVSYAPSSTAVGSGGTTTLTWKTKGALPLVGKHAVSLEYRRPGTTNAPAKRFSFTINIVKAAPPPVANALVCESYGAKLVLKKDPAGTLTAVVTGTAANYIRDEKGKPVVAQGGGYDSGKSYSTTKRMPSTFTHNFDTPTQAPVVSFSRLRPSEFNGKLIGYFSGQYDPSVTKVDTGYKVIIPFFEMTGSHTTVTYEYANWYFANGDCKAP